MLHPSPALLNIEPEKELISNDKLYVDDELLKSVKVDVIGGIDYISMTVAELKSLAENKGIQIVSGIKKDELIKLLQESEV